MRDSRSRMGQSSVVSNQTNKQKILIASNLIQLSNIEYLYKFVNYVGTTPKSMFEKCLENAEKAIEKDDSSKISKQIKSVEYTKISRDYLLQRQDKIAAEVKKCVRKSIQKPRISQHLSKQQLLNLASSKIQAQRLKEQKQMAKSRRSFEYIQNLKHKIQTQLSAQKQKQPQYVTLELEEIIKHLQHLQSSRSNMKMQLYYIEKDQKQTENKKQTYLRLAHNLETARHLYQDYLAQIQLNSTNKSYLLNQNFRTTSPQRSLLLPEGKRKNIARIQKFLNAIMLDQRQLQLIGQDL